MTQGMVVVTRNGKVEVKVVVGSDGYNAGKMAEEIHRMRNDLHWSAKHIRAVALEVGFGDEENLVVMTRHEVLGPKGHELHPRYFDTFKDPDFNPRWDRGTVEHLIKVEL